MNTIRKMTKKTSIFFLAFATVAIMTGCGAGKGNKDNDVKPEQTVAVESSVAEASKEVTVEEPVVESEVVEETVEEVDPSNLSNEDWVKSLNLETGTFILFNDTTGERKVLEEGQEYTLLEGDEIGFWYPLDWEKDEWKFGNLMFIMDYKYECLTMNFDNNGSIDNEKIEMALYDTDGNAQSFTLYLSK